MYPAGNPPLLVEAPSEHHQQEDSDYPAPRLTERGQQSDGVDSHSNPLLRIARPGDDHCLLRACARPSPPVRALFYEKKAKQVPTSRLLFDLWVSTKRVFRSHETRSPHRDGHGRRVVWCVVVVRVRECHTDIHDGPDSCSQLHAATSSDSVASSETETLPSPTSDSETLPRAVRERLAVPAPSKLAMKTPASASKTDTDSDVIPASAR